jgi:hypothetical protein
MEEETSPLRKAKERIQELELLRLAAQRRVRILSKLLAEIKALIENMEPL